MEVFNRRAGERLCVGPLVEVEVLGVEGSEVVLFIRAPRDLSVTPGESMADMAASVRRSLSSPVGPYRRDVTSRIWLPQGLIGRPDLTRMCWAEPEDAVGFWVIASRTDPTVRLPVVYAAHVQTDFPIREARVLAGLTREEAHVMVAVDMTDDEGGPTANMKAPIVIGASSGRAAQVIMPQGGLRTEHPLSVDAGPFGMGLALGAMTG